jgi:hypothetical protein
MDSKERTELLKEIKYDIKNLAMLSEAIAEAIRGVPGFRDQLRELLDKDEPWDSDTLDGDDGLDIT